MRAKSFAGPVLWAISAWCALGHVAATATGSRAIVPASPWWVLGALTFAAIIPGFRRRPWTTTPALAATAAWWPVPLPAVALLWTGGLAWVPLGLAVLAALPAGGARRSSGSYAGKPTPGGGFSRAGLLTLALAAITGWSLAPSLPGGDEPHYLIITQSLLKDGDLQIGNNHAAHDYAAYYGGPLNPDKIQNGRHGEVYSIHAPGTAVLVLPAFALFGYRGAQATIVLIAGLTGALIWWTAWLATGDRRAAWFAWAAVTGSATFLFQSVTIFPDGPGALISAWAAVVMVSLYQGASRVGLRRLASTGAALATLPWLHTRFAVLAAGLGTVLVWLLVRDVQRPLRIRLQRVAALGAVPVVSALAWFGFFLVLYGTPNPSAPYGPDPDTHLGYIPGGVVALLFDQQFGLLAYAPVLAFAAAAVGKGDALRRLVMAALAVVAAYLVAVAAYWMWWAGVPATPARFASAALPLLAVPLAVAWRRSGFAGRAWGGVLLAVSLSISIVVIGVDRGALLWNARNTAAAAWLAWLGTAADLPRAWPSFFWRLGAHTLGGETVFLTHVTLELGAIAAVGMLLTLVRRMTRAAGGLLWCAWGVIAAVMAVAGVGWTWTGSSGIDRSRPSLIVAHDMQAGRSVFLVGALHVRRLRDPSALTVAVSRGDADDGSGVVWAPLENVPSGRYRATIAERRPVAGTIGLQLFRSPLSEIVLQASVRQDVDVTLPVAARVLAFVPDDRLRDVITSIELTPVGLPPSKLPPPRTLARYGDTTLFFFDENVFIEPDGFWVRGGQTALFAVLPGSSTVTPLTFSNGPAANPVRMDIGNGGQDFPMRPSETFVIDLPSNGDAAVPVRITSPGAFRPSDDGQSTDKRALGVRIAIGRRPKDERPR